MMLGSWDGAELCTFLPSSPLCSCWSLPLSGQRYCCKNLLMVVNVHWRSWFAARVGRCVLSLLLVLGWDMPWSPPASHPPSRLGARTAQPACPWHPAVVRAWAPARAEQAPRLPRRSYKVTWKLRGWGGLSTTRAKPRPRHELAMLALEDAVVSCGLISTIPGWGFAALQPRCYPWDSARSPAARCAPRSCALCHRWLNVSRARRRKL